MKMVMKNALFLLVLLLVGAHALVAQSAPEICWRSPRPNCELTIVTEVHVQAVLLSSKRTLFQDFGSGGQSTTKEDGLRGLTLGWDVGMLKRIDDRRAVGAAIEIGVADGALRTALKARGRQYLSDNLSAELAVGLVRGKGGSFSSGLATGLTTNLRINAADKVSVFVTYDDMPWADAPPNTPYTYTDTARARGIRAGASLGSMPAVIGTGVGGLLWLGLLALFLASGAGY